jgi:hypothetical protein
MARKIKLYNLLKGKRKKWAYADMYTDYASIMCANQFDYDTPDFNKYFYENSILTGVAAFYKCPVTSSVNHNKWCCTPAKMADVIDNEEISDKITTFGSDYSCELTVNKDCILVFNNSAHLPEYYIGVIADMLAETDLSTNALVKWSRMSPIPKAKSDSDIVKYTTAMERVLNGEEITVIDDSSSLFTDGHTTIDDNILRLSDEKAIDKMHFYSEFYDQLIRRLCTLRGVPFSTNAKSAQSLNDELHDMDIFSTFYLTDCYETRKKCFEKCEEFSNHKFNFKWSEFMQIQIDKIKKMNIIKDGETNDNLSNRGTTGDNNGSTVGVNQSE